MPTLPSPEPTPAPLPAVSTFASTGPPSPLLRFVDFFLAAAFASTSFRCSASSCSRTCSIFRLIDGVGSAFPITSGAGVDFTFGVCARCTTSAVGLAVGHGLAAAGHGLAACHAFAVGHAFAITCSVGVGVGVGCGFAVGFGVGVGAGAGVSCGLGVGVGCG